MFEKTLAFGMSEAAMESIPEIHFYRIVKGNNWLGVAGYGPREVEGSVSYRRTYNSFAMALKAAMGSGASVMGRPITICEAPLSNASFGVATRL